MSSCSRPIDVFQRSAGHAYLVPCGKCAECLERKRQQWILRAQYAFREYKNRYFITLSYDDAFLPYESYSRKKDGKPYNPVSTGEAVLHPYDLRKFFERFRIYSGCKFAYFACGEYGSQVNTHRPHYHICLFCDLPWNEVLKYVRLAWSRLVPETKDERKKRYCLSKRLGKPIKRDASDMHNRVSFGRDQVRCLTFKRITYVSKYVTKQLGSNEVVPTFYRVSNGLGKSFLESVECKILKEANQHYAYLQSGLPCALPRYYSIRMFTAKQMEVFQLKMIEAVWPFEGEVSVECIKSWLENKINRDAVKHRMKNLRFQGVRLL